MKSLGIAALAAATLLFSTSVCADVHHVSGHASLSNVQVTVIDLTPDDGNMAGYDLSVRANEENRFGASYFNGSDYASHQGLLHSAVPVHVSLEGGGFSALAHAEGGIGNSSFDIAAITPGGNSSAYAYGQRNFTIVLRPNSALSISGYASGWITRSRELQVDEFFSNATTALQLNYISINGPQQDFWAGTGLGPNAIHGEFGEAFSFSAVNERDYDIELSLSTYGSAGYSAVLAVPEPSIWLMLAAGFLILGYRVRPGRPAR